MADPPIFVGAVNAMLTDKFPGVDTSDVGSFGIARGVAVTPLDTIPYPAELIAFKYTVYAVEFERPVKKIGDVVCAGEQSVYVVPLSIEYA
jgi:hypothetical protein